MSKIKFSIITLFPEALRPYLDSSMLYKAQARGILEVEYINLRDFGLGPHKSVDDTPYGGGDGMLLRCEPVFAAIESIKMQDPSAKVILPTPVGQTWNQDLVRQFAGISTKSTCDFAGESGSSMFCEEGAKAESEQGCWPGALATNGERTEPVSPVTTDRDVAPPDSRHARPQTSSPRHYIILCPHYEGYDERIMTLVDYPISLGNYILTGGELPALIIIDSITRLLPGVLGGATSAEIESFSDGDNLEFPQYTKPADFRGLKVPEVLLSGDHGKVDQWRIEHSSRKTSK